MKGGTRGALFKRVITHTHTQISFGVTAHANEWAKTPPTGWGNPTVQSLRPSLVRLARALHYSKAAFEYNSVVTSCVLAVRPFGDLNIKQGTGWFKSQRTTLLQKNWPKTQHVVGSKTPHYLTQLPTKESSITKSDTITPSYKGWTVLQCKGGHLFGK